MCVQFIQPTDLKKLAALYDAQVLEQFEWKQHVFPRYPSAVFVLQNGKRMIKKMNFGFIPFFEKNPKPKKVFHNARVETISEKISFKKPFLETRCLVPLESFLEYIWTDDKTNWIARFSSKKEELLTAAAIWNGWKSPDGTVQDTYSIITTEPPPFILETGHDRCPLFLEEHAFSDWLNPDNKTAAELYHILKNKKEIDFKVEKFNKK
jgi:putative SOS response-associated peptidase YedK